MRTPVALFIFNRPGFTAQVLEAIARERPPRLLVVGDGPRAQRPQDADLVRETRAVIERVDWPCEVLTHYAEENMGCGARIASGLDWVFANCEEAIILEDDCVPDATFFPFCEQLLDRYRDDERVQMISGCYVLEPGQFGPQSYYFSRCYHIWGWATWSRAWRHYDYEMRRWPELRETDWLERHLKSHRAAEISTLLFDETYAGRIRQWDFQWVLAGWLRDAVSAIPTVNLVQNIGFGDAATHLQDPNHPRANLRTTPMTFPLAHPPAVEVLEQADRAEWESVFPNYPPSPSGTTDQRLVMGAAIGLPAADVRPFLSSLRAAGYLGRVVLVVDRALRRVLERDPLAENVTLLTAARSLPFTHGLLTRRAFMRWAWAPFQWLIWMLARAAGLIPMAESRRLRLQSVIASVACTPMERRFVTYRRYLEEHPHRRVLLTDVRDVLFQSDPFAALPATGISVSIESGSYTVASEPHNRAWIERAYGSELLGRIGNNRVACLGVTYGEGGAISDYLRLMVSEIIRLTPSRLGVGGADTAIHNALLWTDRLDTVHQLETLASPVATFNGIDEASVKLSSAGRVLNQDGSEPSVLHQYDRLPALGPRLRRALGGSSPRA